MALNSHKSEKKKKKLYKDSFSLAAMIRKFQKEKEAFKKKDSNLHPTAAVGSISNKPPAATATAINDVSDLNLCATDAVLSLFNSTSDRELLQEAESAMEMLGDFDFDRLLDGASSGSPVSEPSGENGSALQPVHTSEVLALKQVPALPEGLPAHLEKRIEDLRVVSILFWWSVHF